MNALRPRIPEGKAKAPLAAKAPPKAQSAGTGEAPETPPWKAKAPAPSLQEALAKGQGTDCRKGTAAECGGGAGKDQGTDCRKGTAA